MKDGLFEWIALIAFFIIGIVGAIIDSVFLMAASIIIIFVSLTSYRKELRSFLGLK